ncbi:MAG: M18 family aminopeptidase [Firmicutes bacterium]|nr:M18 family aminopeptidase [Bacillota bacterium]
MYEKITSEFIDFAMTNPTCFHAIEAISSDLKDAGYEELKETAVWRLESEGKYFTTRNNSSLIVFKVPKNNIDGFNIAAAHTDSPALKIKGMQAEMTEGAYLKLNVEVYGGLLMSTWFDRPLSLAGRLMVKEKGKLIEKLVKIDRDLLMLPSVAIHMNRDANKGIEYNAQKDLLPLFAMPGLDSKKADKGQKNSNSSLLSEIIGKAAKINPKNIMSCDLFVYDRTPGSIWGANNEFFSVQHIDDLECAYTAIRALIDAPVGASQTSMPMVALFDNEEVGSETKQGADSTFLDDTLERIAEALGWSAQKKHAAIAGSFLVSADNAHAVHPNHPEYHDPVNKPVMNKGIVIKYAANQHYATDSVSSALFKELCDISKVPYQEFYNRSDKPGGSTLGNISNTHVSVNSVDIGLPQLAMHSCYETAGMLDAVYLAKVFKTFFSKSLVCDNGYSFK